MKKETLVKLVWSIQQNLNRLHNQIKFSGVMTPENEELHAKYDRLQALKRSYELTLNGGQKHG